MAIAITNIGVGGNGTGAATVVLSGVTVPAGAVIVVGWSENADFLPGPPGGSVADDAGNSYTSIVSANNNNNQNAGYGNIAYSTTGKALSNQHITITKAGGGNKVSASAVYITGAAASSPLDTSVTAHATGQSGTPSVTSGTAAVSGELILGWVSWNPPSATTFTQASGFSTPPNKGTVESRAIIAGGSLINAGTGTETFAPTNLDSGSAWAAFIIGFMPAAAAAFVPFAPVAQLGPTIAQ